MRRKEGSGAPLDGTAGTRLHREENFCEPVSDVRRFKWYRGKKSTVGWFFVYSDTCSGFASTSSLVYVRRVPRLNKLLVGEGAPFRFLAILSGQFDYILSIFCLFLALYILL